MNFTGLLTLLLALALMQSPDLVDLRSPAVAPPSPEQTDAEGPPAQDTTDEEAQDRTDPHAAGFSIAPGDGGAAADPLRLERDAAYQGRLLSAFKSAQGRQGALDGRWTVSSAGGAALFVLQLADPGAGEGRIEGAWRDLKQAGPKGSGFIDAVARDGDFTVVRFLQADPDQATEVRVRPAEGGAWIGETVAGTEVQPIVMQRAAGVETAALAAPLLAPEPRAAAPKAKARPAPKRGKASKSRPRAAPKRARAKSK